MRMAQWPTNFVFPKRSFGQKNPIGHFKQSGFHATVGLIIMKAKIQYFASFVRRLLLRGTNVGGPR